MYCVKFENVIKPYFGFFRPYNAVRDSETYSLTYLTPSILNGMEENMDIPFGSIKRHKLTFSKERMDKEQVKTSFGYRWENGEQIKCSNDGNTSGIHLKHCLINPVIVLGFENKEFAEIASKSTLYLGQTEYLVYPSNGVYEVSEKEFDELPGVETFPSDENGVDCGFNRFKNNEPMFIGIKRIEW